MTIQSERRLLALVCAFSFALFSLYSSATPLFEASDELWHYPMVMQLATGGGLPIQRKDQTDADAPWRQEGSQPPLYYALAALVSAPFDHSNWREIRRINPHSDMGVPTRDGNANIVLHTAAEAFPWTRAALAARIARLLSILLSTGTVAAAWLVARELFQDNGTQNTDNRGKPEGRVRLSSVICRLCSAVFVACIPMFAFISGSINNDNAAAFFCTLGLWWALRVARLRDHGVRAALIAGVITAAGVMSKSSALGLAGLFGLALLFGLQIDRAGLLRAARWLAIMSAVIAVLSGWWFVRNLQLYGDLLGWNAFLDVVGRRDTPATLAQLWTEREGFVWAFWGVFGAVNVIMPPWVYTLLNGIVLLAVGGLGRLLVQQRTRVRAFLSSAVGRAWLLALIWIAVIFVALLRWTALTPASQGRLMFPAIAALAAVLVAGLAALHRLAALAASALLTIVALLVPFTVIAPAYAIPAGQWQSRLSMPVNAAFGNAVVLVEGQMATDSVVRGAELTLALNWELTRPPTKNMSVFVHLINADDVIVAQRDMYPGQGNLALAEAQAGYRWSDRYTLKIPIFAVVGQPLRWAVGLYDRESGERLRLPDGTERAIFPAGTVTNPQAAQAQSLFYRYDSGAKLIDVQAAATRVKRGESLRVSTRWRDVNATARPLNVSAQIIDAQQNKAGAQDLALPAASDALEFVIPISQDAAPGVYHLLLVMYVPEGEFTKIAAYDGAGNFAGEQIVITQIRVE